MVKALRLGIISIRSGKLREFEPHSSHQDIFVVFMTRNKNLTIFRVTAHYAGPSYRKRGLVDFDNIR